MRADFNLFDQYHFTHEGAHLLLANVLEYPCSNSMLTGCRYRVHALLQTNLTHCQSAQINSYTHTIMHTHAH